MQLGGPMKDAKILGYIPGPGQYDANKSMLDPRASSLRPRLPDTAQNHLIRVSFFSFRIQVLELMAMTKWEVKCITQHQNFVTTPTIKLHQAPVSHR